MLPGVHNSDSSRVCTTICICKMQNEVALFILQQNLHHRLHFAVGLRLTCILRESGGFFLLSSSRTAPTVLSHPREQPHRGRSRMRRSSHGRPHQGKSVGRLRWLGGRGAAARQLPWMRRLPSRAGAHHWSRIREGSRMLLECFASGSTVFFSPYCIEKMQVVQTAGVSLTLPPLYGKAHPRA